MALESTPETSPPDGTLEEIDGRYVLRFERRYPHPVERVWDALTKPEQIKQWLPVEGEVEIELVEGGKYADRDSSVTVLRVEAPHVFEHTFHGGGDSVVRWELQPDGDGCRLLFTQTGPSREFFVDQGLASGWHMCFELLGHSLDGQPVEWSKVRWEEHRDRYAAKQ